MTQHMIAYRADFLEVMDIVYGQAVNPASTILV